MVENTRDSEQLIAPDTHRIFASLIRGFAPVNSSVRGHLLESKESTRKILISLLDSFPESEDPVYAAQQIGRCFLKLREFHSATEWLNRALELAPNDPWTHLYLGNLAHHKNQYDRALVYFLRASEIMPDDPTPFWCIGDIYDAMGKPKEAGEYYRKAHSLDPENTEANIRLDEWNERNYAP